MFLVVIEAVQQASTRQKVINSHFGATGYQEHRSRRREHAGLHRVAKCDASYRRSILPTVPNLHGVVVRTGGEQVRMNRACIQSSDVVLVAIPTGEKHLLGSQVPA